MHYLFEWFAVGAPCERKAISSGRSARETGRSRGRKRWQGRGEIVARLCGIFSSSSLISFELPGTFQSAHTSHVAKRERGAGNRQERWRQRQKKRGRGAAAHSLRQLKWSRRSHRRRRQSVAYVRNEARLDFSRRIVLPKLFTHCDWQA